MSKSLVTIQKISKLGKVLSNISWIASLVGLIGCVIGIVSLEFMPQDFTMKYVISVGEGTTMQAIYGAIIAGMIMCCAQIRLGRVGSRYFKHELEAGTPFTFEGAKEMKSLGIQVIVISLLANILAAAAYAIVTFGEELTNDNVLDMNVNLGLGIMFLVTAVICKYGAELLNPYEEENA